MQKKKKKKCPKFVLSRGKIFEKKVSSAKKKEKKKTNPLRWARKCEVEGFIIFKKFFHKNLPPIVCKGIVGKKN